MLKVLLFVFSISIDAFGYSVGFGSNNFKLSRFQFLILNLVNVMILTIYMLNFPKLSFIISSKIAPYLSSILLLVLGSYHCIASFRALYVSLVTLNKNICIKQEFETEIFSIIDLLFLLFVFVFENMFSTLVFYTSLSHPAFFVISCFCMHYLFFMVGFDVGIKLKKYFPFDSRFITYNIFIIIGLMNLYENIG